MTFIDGGRKGFDVSTYQDASSTPAVINFQKMKEWGADFVIIKIGQGSWIDQDWDVGQRNSLGVIPRNGYWYYDPRYSPQVQAQVCLSAITNSGIKRVWIDLEFITDGAYSNPSYWRIFAELIIAGGYKIGIYTRKTWWDDRVGLYVSYFAQFPFWVAQYNTSLTMLPAGCTEAMLWQNAIKVCADIGLVGVVESLEIDHNIWNENFSFEAEWGVELPIGRFAGVKQIYTERYGCKTYINIIEPSKVRFEVRNEDGYPSQICKKYGAQIAWNGDDWYRDTRQVKNNDSPSLLIFPDKTIQIGDWRIASGETYHSSGLRYLVQNGQNVIPVNGTEAKYKERHARTVSGKTRAGAFFHATIDGEYPDKGALLYECAQIALEFDCLDAFDQGGGGDSVEVLNGNVMNIPDDDVNGVHYERKVPQTILVFANQGESMTNGTAKEKLGNIAKKRLTPSRYGTDVGQVPAGGTIEFTEIVPVQPQGIADKTGEEWFKLPDNTYVNYKLQNQSGVLVEYFTILTMPSASNLPAYFIAYDSSNNPLGRYNIQ